MNEIPICHAQLSRSLGAVQEPIPVHEVVEVPCYFASCRSRIKSAATRSKRLQCQKQAFIRQELHHICDGCTVVLILDVDLDGCGCHCRVRKIPWACFRRERQQRALLIELELPVIPT